MADALPAKRRLRLLIVDDEPEIRRLVAVSVARALPEIDVSQEGTGADALARLAKEPADFILSDFRMPGMDGLEFLQRSIALAPQASRIMVTAYPDTMLAIRALNEGHIARFLTKPFSPRDMVDALRALLAKREAAEAKALGLAKAFAGAG